MELGLVISHWKVAPEAGSLLQSPTPPIDTVHNTLALGQILYSDYIYLFQIAQNRVSCMAKLKAGAS